MVKLIYFCRKYGTAVLIDPIGKIISLALCIMFHGTALIVNAYVIDIY